MTARNGRYCRDRGARFERSIVAHVKAAGLEAQRIPLSGSAGGDFAGDVQIKAFRPLNGECKKRARGFDSLYNWLGSDHDFLAIGRDRSEPLVVVRLDFFLALLKGVQP